VRKLRVAREGIDAAHLFCPKPNFLINFLSRRAQTTSENSVKAKFAQKLLPGTSVKTGRLRAEAS
jgi:hypothetical protein